jgi:hypothetical protein
MFSEVNKKPLTGGIMSHELSLKVVEFDCPVCDSHHRLEDGFELCAESELVEYGNGDETHFVTINFRCPNWKPGPGRPSKGGPPWHQARLF